MDGYDGQSIQQILALTNEYRIDSIMLAIEEALQRRPFAELSEPERVVLAIEAFEREVNNGGYEQFFTNSSEFVPGILESLNAIRCAKTSQITADAIALLKLPERFDSTAARLAASTLSPDDRKKLAQCDSRYFQNDESIEQGLLTFIVQHQSEIKLR